MAISAESTAVTPFGAMLAASQKPAIGTPIHTSALPTTMIPARQPASALSTQERLVRLPPPPLPPDETPAPRGGSAALLSTDDLEGVRDRLLERLDELDTQRAVVLERLEQLGLEEVEADDLAPEPPGRGVPSLAGARTERAEEPSRRASPSLAGARIRWVGA